MKKKEHDCYEDLIFDQGFYYFNGKKLIDCTRFDKKNNSLYAKPPKGKNAYPRYENYTSDQYASMEFGIDGHSWWEVHYCPKCKKEYGFSNSDY